MLSPKQKRLREIHQDRKLICTKCGSIMRDCEPMNPDGEGEFNHPLNECINRGKSFLWNYDPKLNQFKWGKNSRVHGIQQFVPKKYRR